MNTKRCTSANWPVSTSSEAAYARSGMPKARPASTPVKIEIQPVSGCGTAPNGSSHTIR